MLNHYAWWKYALIGIVLAAGLVYASPNLFDQDQAVQISSASTSVVLDETLYTRVIGELQGADIAFKSVTLNEQRMLVRFADSDTQLKAADQLRVALGRNYIVALNLAPSTPDFMRALDLNPMYLGLDLRGGVHFLMEVDMEAAIAQAEEGYLETLRVLLRENKVYHAGMLRTAQGGMRLNFNNAAERDKAEQVISDEYPALQIAKTEQGNDLLISMTEEEIQEKRQFALQQNITTLRNRVNELGVAEPIIQRQGANRIVVQLPGVQDTTRAKEILGATATLEFRLVHDGSAVLSRSQAAEAEAGGPRPSGARLYREREGNRPILLDRRVIITGEHIIDARAGFDPQTGSPDVTITLDGKGERRMTNATKDNVGKDMAVVFIENKTETQRDGEELKRVNYTVEEVINVATIRDRLGKRFHITGLDSPREASNLALLLRAGSLAAPITIVEERTVGPSAGQENIDQGFNAALIAFLLVLAFMALYYRMFGLVSDLALIVNMVLIIATLSMLQATLTLPGIAGIILTMGMAVDANVLIFERIREELNLGNSPQAAIHTGYGRAFSTILDANITTLIAAVILGGISSGPVRGFAVTLGIGILTSMFSAIMGSRAVINSIYGGRRLQTLPI